MRLVDIKERLVSIQKIMNPFWKKWQCDYFPTMLIRKKGVKVEGNVKSW